MMRRFLLPLLLMVSATSAVAQTGLPPLPDSTGWGVHVLAVARDPGGNVWVGTYGQGIYRLRNGARQWESIRHDSTGHSISWDFVQAFGFGPRGEVWYGTVGNGWGLSLDDGRTWRNWTLNDLGPEWQYVAPDGIALRHDTVAIATADGLQLTADDGQHWLAIGDTVGPAARGPADTAVEVLPSEYVTRLSAEGRSWTVATLRGFARVFDGPSGWTAEPVSAAGFKPLDLAVVNGRVIKGSYCGLRPASDTLPCYRHVRAPAAAAPKAPLTTWFQRPISQDDNPYIDQTYRYGSTMGGNFQQHQGVEFNNPDGTPVHAIGSGEVVYSGPAEAGANTVAILHDSVLVTPAGKLRIYSVYYHNSKLEVKVGDHVTEGQEISRVGNTGRATNDHLHLEVHASPTDSVGAIVDSLQRFPPYTTNPELWIAPLPGTGIVAGQVWGPDGKPVQQARIYGLRKPQPIETPFSYIETYGDRAHSHPLYHEHFAVSDVPPGRYVLGTEIAGRKVFRTITVVPGQVTWVVFR